ncbi:STAS domain-containing protein [Cryptosporangium aurantiacum]|uniref:STAS domain-containing protein n=1 Tax=Cryptosporangium aurantiacum TaxID=134849 RepID=UPI0009346D0A|nr:STAS domain-containing protein [Cryptosporangium aurantiacum]
MSLVGDVDTAATRLLSDAVDWLADDRAPVVLIDLAAVTYAGSALLNFLVRLFQVMPADTEVILWRPSPRANFVLRTATMRRSDMCAMARIS